MELEHKIHQLEQEMAVLKEEIEGTLLDIRKVVSADLATPAGWRKRAWVLALLNVLVATTLFTNIRWFSPDSAAPVGTPLGPWLRATWVALTFVWLILQMYPLALLLDQEDARPREVAWRNAAALFRSNPGLTTALTILVLAIAVISMLFPSLWLLATAGLFAIVCTYAAMYALRLRQARLRSGKN